MGLEKGSWGYLRTYLTILDCPADAWYATKGRENGILSAQNFLVEIEQ